MLAPPKGRHSTTKDRSNSPHASRSSGSRSRMTCTSGFKFSTQRRHQLKPSRRGRTYASQRGRHVTRRDAVHSDVLLSPLDCQRRSHVADGSLGSVVRSLRLRDVCEETGNARETGARGVGERKENGRDLLTQAPDMEPMRTIVPGASRFIMSLAASRAQ